jgi:MSHA biogenesis protein MshK
MRPARFRAALCAAGLVLAAAVAGHASAVDDPTRPPSGLRAGTGQRGVSGDGLVLQTVIIAPGNRSAIISGEHVMLGGKIGNARLVKVNEAAVVLLIGSTQRRLELYPGVHKRHGARDAAGE